MAEFLHGVETLEQLVGPQLIQMVSTGIVGIVGTAPIHHSDGAPPAVNSLVLVRNDRGNGQFGPSSLDGYTIPRALKAVQKLGAGVAFVVNVFDPTVHLDTVAPASRTITAGRITLPDGDIISCTVATIPESGSPVTCVAGVDYTINRLTGVITVLAAGLLGAEGVTTAMVGYTKGAPQDVTAANIIGETSSAGVRTGMQAWRNAMSLFAFDPKILIAPGFSPDATVRDAMSVLADLLRAVALVDVAVGATVEQVVQGRLPGGTLDLTSVHERVWYQYPHVKVTEPSTGLVRLEPLSQYIAGRISKTDAERGTRKSPSNMPLLGIAGTELPLTASINDRGCDVNILNAAGVNTVFAGSAGYRAWGNRSAAFPSSQAITTFISVRRTHDMLDDACERGAMRFVDEGVNDVTINAFLADINELVRAMVAEGSLIPGSRIEYFPEDNPPVQLAAGHIVFARTALAPPAAELITIKSLIDINLLANVGT